MDWVEQFDKQVADFLPDVKIAAAEPMAKHTSFRVGGPARRMAFPDQIGRASCRERVSSPV